MNDCKYEILNTNVIGEIENILGINKFVYAIAIDDEGNAMHLIGEDAKFHTLSQPIFTQKFMVGSISFSSVIDSCEKTLDNSSFCYIDELLKKQQKFILAFDSEGSVIPLKRSGEEGICNFSCEIKSRSIAYGVFEGSCCYFSVIGGVNVPIFCVNIDCSRCPPPLRCV